MESPAEWDVMVDSQVVLGTILRTKDLSQVIFLVIILGVDHIPSLHVITMLMMESMDHVEIHNQHLPVLNHVLLNLEEIMIQIR